MSNINNNDFLWGNFNPESAAEIARRERMGATWDGNDLDRDAFLRLLITQMQFQDPLDPVSDKEFVAQLAQFTALEQMNQMNASMRQQQAFGMVGRTIEGRTLNPETGLYQDIAGRVDSVVTRAGETFLHVNGFDIALNRVTSVYEDELQMMMWHNMSNLLANNQNIALIGRHVQALVAAPGGGMAYVEGVVDFIRFVNGSPILVIDGRDIPPQNVITVADDALLFGRSVTLSMIDTETNERIVRTGGIDAINIVGERAFVVVGNYTSEIGPIDVFTEAIRSVGRQVAVREVNETTGEVTQDVSGVITSIVVRDGELFVTVGAGPNVSASDSEVRFANVRAPRP